MRTVFFLTVFLFAAPLFGTLEGCRTQNPGSLEHKIGPTNNGLQMSLAVIPSADNERPKFEISIRNIGTNDTSLVLGYMLANGKVMLPKNIGLILTDSSGKTRKLTFSDRRYPAVSGRIDDYVVPLRAGSTYSLRLGLTEFVSLDTNEFDIKLKPGTNKLSAQFQGTAAEIPNLDMQGVKLMKFWTGKLDSNVLTVTN
jgi:hypothetical protein